MFDHLEGMEVYLARELLLKQGLSVTTTPHYLGWVHRDQWWVAFRQGINGGAVSKPTPTSQEEMKSRGYIR